MRLSLAFGREKLWLDFPQHRPVNVAQVLQSTKDTQPEIYESWCDKDGRLRRSLAVFVNGEHIRYRKGLETELDDGDQIYVIPIIAGGQSVMRQAEGGEEKRD